MPPITFTNNDFTAIDPVEDDHMVITVEINKFEITKVLVDQGSSVDILYWKTFRKMRIPETRDDVAGRSALHRFAPHLAHKIQVGLAHPA